MIVKSGDGYSSNEGKGKGEEGDRDGLTDDGVASVQDGYGDGRRLRSCFRLLSGKYL